MPDTAYRNDPRVTACGDGFTAATDDDGPVTVLATWRGWTVFSGYTSDLDGQVPLGSGFSDADAALRAVLGKPKRRRRGVSRGR